MEKAPKLLPDVKVEWVQGAMEDVPGFEHARDGMDVLFHTAPNFREVYGPGDHDTKLEAINVRGSETLMRAAHRRGVTRAVDTSSSGILGVAPNGAESDENTPPGPLQTANPSLRSKVRSEKALQARRAETDFPISFVLPGWMFGPQDAAPTRAGQVVLDFLHQKLPGILDAGTSGADARDVAQAMVSIVERGKAGERCMASGPFADFQTLRVTQQSVSGVPAPRRHIPQSVSLGFAYLSELWARLTGVSSVASVLAVRTLQAKLRVSSAKSIRELGATYRPLGTTLADTVTWMRRWRGLETPLPQGRVVPHKA